MDRQEALFTIGGEHQQFDLAALDEIDHIALIAAGVDVVMSGDLEGARIHGLAY